MSIKKSLKDISWLVPEEEYRADPALSYSTLAKYERTGFNSIEYLFDKIETPSLIFGSAVDAIITGGEEEFNSRFMVAEFPAIPDSIITIVRSLFNSFNKECKTIESISDDRINTIAALYDYQSRWRAETRAKVIREKGSEYYKLLYVSQDKTILSTSTYEDVVNAVDALKNSEATKEYFSPDNPFDNIERCYQLKFKGSYNGVDYRCMMDLVKVDHDKKEITPIDLKTSGHPEHDFHGSFNQWRYDIQARLYSRLLKMNLAKDDYFKDFTVHPYLFIVVNRNTLNPLVWEFEDTFKEGTLEYGEHMSTKFRDPYVIGEELNYYLKNNSKVPTGINLTGKNSLVSWLNTIK
jgi:hypothetical protein